MAQRTIDASADQARHVAEASVQEAQRGLDRSSRQFSTVANQAAHAAREGTQRTSENLGVAMQVVTTAASGYQSVVTELVEQGQQAFKRNVDTFNQALRVRSTTDLLNIQNSLSPRQPGRRAEYQRPDLGDFGRDRRRGGRQAAAAPERLTLRPSGSCNRLTSRRMVKAIRRLVRLY